jgi:DNA polymerase-1
VIIKPSSREAIKLFHDGTRTFAEIEHNGIAIDTALLNYRIEELGRSKQQIEEELRGSAEYSRMRKRFGKKTNLSSVKQVAHLLYVIEGHQPVSFTETGAPSVDEKSLSAIGSKFCKNFLKYRKIEKLTGTFLAGIKSETVNGRMHPFFGLTIPRTFRSSSDSPNFQNFPVRDKWMSKMIRELFVAERGYHLLEIDYKAIEVCAAAWYHKDPAMLSYIEDPTKDMHRDMAAQCFMAEPDQVSKMMRYCGKNMFVFPQFYGDVYVNNASALWEAVEKHDLQLNDGTPVNDHLLSMGIDRRGACSFDEEPTEGSFEFHIRQVERDFWQRRFKHYGQWKRDWWAKYQVECGMTTLTGFRIEGPLSRKDAINYPVQGVAFQCLLWSAIEITNYIRKNKMRSRIVGQIHDSIIVEVHESEIAEFAAVADYIMTVAIREHWQWIITNLVIECDITEENGRWNDKMPIEVNELLEMGYDYDE